MVAARSSGIIVPPWVIWTAAAALLLALYTGFRYRIASYSEQLAPLAASLPPTGTIATPTAARAALPALPAPRPVLDPGFLAEEQRQGLVTVQEGAQRALIRLTASDLFAPGSDQIAATRRALIDRIGQELATRPGRILVTGYTDNVPLRRSPRFASNLELSEAHATLIGDLLANPLRGKDRLTIVGKGDAEPIASNASPTGARATAGSRSCCSRSREAERMRFLKGILAVLTARWFLTLIGAAILAALIWYFGPLLAVADQKPLTSDFNRLLAILGITLLWGASNLWSLRRSHARGQALVEAVAKPPPGVPNAEVTAVAARFKDAMDRLKVRRFSKGRLYQLPWYLMIGPPGSGKTTALLQSGLRFPLDTAQELKGVGGTRNCDWFFTDEAVLLDTAGRWTTQDSDRSADEAAGRGFSIC